MLIRDFVRKCKEYFSGTSQLPHTSIAAGVFCVRFAADLVYC